jgi:S-adenosylmethionine decarboxylase
MVLFDMIGLHLLVDGVMEECINKQQGKEILEKLPEKIGMKILNGPHVVEGNPENPGWTGFVIIDKSHIAIHTFTENNTISVDIFSCKPFNAKETINYLKEHVNFLKIRTRVLPREVL